MDKITGDMVRAARVHFGITLDKMADEIGCSVTTIIRWEKGRTHVSSVYRAVLEQYFQRKARADWRQEIKDSERVKVDRKLLRRSHESGVTVRMPAQATLEELNRRLSRFKSK
jgi:transcriptional regulator with XRE-family HTH domain